MRTVLHDLVLNDDDEELNDFLKDPSNKRMINEPDAIGWTPLHWACSKGLKNSVSALLENGADPNKGTDYDGWTPAHDAARCGNSEILELLAKAGADIETTTSSGTRPLHYAVQYGRTKAMQWMCKEGCDVDLPNVAGWSPLHFAVRHGRVHAAHLLLDLGAVANMPDKSGHTPEDLARITKDKIKKGILHLDESVQLDDFDKVADMLAEKTKAQRDAAVGMAKHALENADSHFEAEDYFGAIEHFQVARDEYARVGMKEESMKCSKRIAQCEELLDNENNHEGTTH
mmetsp:Transcript_16296/g.37225  ORF Transcript_16296/g.37225 Transcript_16296/m.37225 type:complete len:287 (-) Transcript_16296:297-1157(-)